MDWKRSFYPSPTGTNNTRWETEAVCMSMTEYSIRNATGRFNTRLKFWGCTNPPRYHADRFHTYINCPNKRDPDVDEQENNSIQEHVQNTSMKGGSRGDQDSQEQRGYTYSMEVRSMFSYWRVQITQCWKKGRFGSLDHALPMCEMVNPYTSRSVRLACAGYLKGKYERWNHKSEN